MRENRHSTRTYSTHLARQFAEWGISHAFCVSGADIATFVEALEDEPDMRVIFSTHEFSAGAMADGFSRVAGIPSLAVAIGGPGASNLAAAASTAGRDGSSIVYVTGSELSPPCGRNSPMNRGTEATRRPFDLVLLGAGATGLEVCDIALGNDDTLQIGVIDDNFGGDLSQWNQRGVEILGDRNILTDIDGPYIVTVGDTRTRDSLIQSAARAGLHPHTPLLHRTANSARAVEIGHGSVVYQNAVMSTNVRIGDHTLVYMLVSLGHDVSVGRNCVIAPGVNVSGNVVVEDGAFVGSGSILLPSVRVGKGTVVGAGSVVTKDLAPHTVAFGNPAVPHREVSSLRSEN